MYDNVKFEYQFIVFYSKATFYTKEKNEVWNEISSRIHSSFYESLEELIGFKESCKKSKKKYRYKIQKRIIQTEDIYDVSEPQNSF